MSKNIQTIIKNDFIHYYKSITYTGRQFKKIEYFYDIFENGQLKSYCHNSKHPAVIVYSNDKITRLEYWIKGELHRINKPAIIILKQNKITSEIWYHNNIKLSDDEVDSIKKSIDRRKKIIKVILKNRLLKEKGSV